MCPELRSIGRSPGLFNLREDHLSPHSWFTTITTRVWLGVIPNIQTLILDHSKKILQYHSIVAMVSFY